MPSNLALSSSPSSCSRAPHRIRGHTRRVSDDRLRSSERAAQHGDPVARARHLGELVRSGQVDEGYLGLAAHVGDAGACLIANASNAKPTSFRDWLVAIRAWGQRPMAHAAVAVARAILPFYEQEWGDESLRGIVAAAEAWLRSPSPETARRLEDPELVEGLGRSVGHRPAGVSARAWDAYVCIDIAIAAVWDVACNGDEPTDFLGDSGVAAARCIPEPEIRAAIARELLDHPEALIYGQGPPTWVSDLENPGE